MIEKRNSCGWLLIGALQVALLAAGCAGQQPTAANPGVKVVPVERAGWDQEPESGLFRMTFDAELSLRIRREASRAGASEGIGTYTAENRVIEVEAERELRARGLCDGSTKLVRPYEDGGEHSGISGIFKCRPPVF